MRQRLANSDQGGFAYFNVYKIPSQSAACKGNSINNG